MLDEMLQLEFRPRFDARMPFRPRIWPNFLMPLCDFELCGRQAVLAINISPTSFICFMLSFERAQHWAYAYASYLFYYDEGRDY